MSLAVAVWLTLVAPDAPPAVTRDATVAADRAVTEAGMDARQRAAMEAVVRDYILKHPEVISEAVGILGDRAKSERIAKVRDQAVRPFPGAVAGNPAGDVTLVVFTDYNCGYCRASVPDLKRLIDADKGVRVVYRELPILSPSSRDAAVWGLAAAAQGKYPAFHDAMFAGEKPSAASIRTAATRAGLDLDAARAYVADPAVAAELATNLDLARALEIGGTPSWLVGGRLLEGAVGYEALAKAVADERAG